MTEHEKKVSDRLNALEEKVAGKKNRVFPTAAVLGVLPICFGLYQLHLSNEFKQEDNQTRALLAALEGESPSDICGNLSLLVEGGLVTDERLVATQALIDEITQKDRNQVDGGIGVFDCLPRIAQSDGGTGNTASAAAQVSLEDRLAARNACYYDEVRLNVLPDQDPQLTARISGYLEAQDIAFAPALVQPSEWEINNYSGQIWYYAIETRRCAKEISAGLATLGVDLKPRYYTREGLPDGLPLRIWPAR